MTDEQSRAELFLRQELGISDLPLVRNSLESTRLALVLSETIAENHLGQLALFTAANILGRLGMYCPSISIYVPPDTTVASGVPLLRQSALLADELIQFMGSVQSREDIGEARFGLCSDDELYDAVLAFGWPEHNVESNAPSASEVEGADNSSGAPALQRVELPGVGTILCKQVVYGWYNRWTGGFSLQQPPVSTTYAGPNPFGALLCGGLCATAVSRLLFTSWAGTSSNIQALPSQASLSALSYSAPTNPETEPDPVNDPVDLAPVEPVLLVGGGAVASAVAFSLLTLPGVIGTIDIVDNDYVSTSNLERHLVSTRADVGSSKATRLASLLGRSIPTLQARAYEQKYEELTSQQWRTVLSAVDNAEVRRRLQFGLPEVLINAGTIGPEFLVSRHDYEDGPCLECLYPEKPRTVSNTAALLSSQVGLPLDEVLELQVTGKPLTENQIERVIKYGRMTYSKADLEGAKHEGIVALAKAACTTAQLRPDLPVATIGFVAAIPGILMAAELVKETLIRAGLLPAALTQHGADTSTVGVLSANYNVFWLDTFGGLEPSLEQSRPSRHCRCQTKLMRSAYASRWSLAAPNNVNDELSS